MFQSAAWRMAWREARASAPKFIFVIFGVSFLYARRQERARARTHETPAS